MEVQSFHALSQDVYEDSTSLSALDYTHGPENTHLLL